MRLADLHHADPYSYELAAVFMGVDSREALSRNFEALYEALDLRFDAKQEARNDMTPESNRAAPD